MITILGKEFQSYKTVPPIENQGAIYNEDCEPTVLPIASLLREIQVKTKTFTFNSSANGLGNQDVRTTITDDFIQAMADYGYDHTVEFHFTFNNPSPFITAYCDYTYTDGLPNSFWQSITRTTDGMQSIRAAKSAVNGSYLNGTEQIYVEYESTAAFSIDIEVRVKQRVVPIYELYGCIPEDEYGSGVPNDPVSWINTTKPQWCYVDYNEDPPTEAGTIRVKGVPGEVNEENDEYDIDVNFATPIEEYVYNDSCSDVYMYYIAKARTLNPDPADEYYFETLAERIQIASYPNSTNPHSSYTLFWSGTQLIDFSSVIFTLGTTDLTELNTPAASPGVFTLSGNLNPLTNRVNITIQYNLTESSCECTCDTDCDQNLIITFYNHCGEQVTLNIEGELVGGKYVLQGDSFKIETGEELYPEVSMRNEYTLNIASYSDETYKALAYIIGHNKEIQIGNRRYIIPMQTLEPSWDTYNQKGTLSLNVIEKESINSVKRNCCG